MKWLRAIFVNAIDGFGRTWMTAIGIIIADAIQEHFLHESPWPLWKWTLYSFLAWVLGLVIFYF